MKITKFIIPLVLGLAGGLIAYFIADNFGSKTIQPTLQHQIVGPGAVRPVVHKSENDVAFTLSPEQQARLITDEQVRYQAFSMLSGNEWARITFEYKGLYRDVLESDIPKLKLLEESTSDGVDQVRYEIETFSLLGFQKYIQRFDGDFVFLKIEAIDNK